MWSRKQLALGVLALVAVPGILACIDPGWLFAPPGIDSWLYLGFFRHFPEYQSGAFPGTYYGSRLSWVLPGYCVHHLLPPVTANCVLHLGVYLLAVLSLFEALRHTASPRAAFLSALFLAGHGPFLASVGWDYVDGVGTAYNLFTWALLVRAARSAAPRPWLFAAGVGAAATLYTNITWLPLLALYLPGYAALRRRWHGRALLSDVETQVALMLCGAAVLTAALGWANRRAGGPLLFYRPSIDFALSATEKKNSWATPLTSWLPIAFWLIWPACVATGSTVYLVLRRLRPAAGPDAPASAWWPVNLLIFALLFVAAAVRGQPLLQLSYYASYLLGPLMLACGTLFTAPLARLSRREFGAVAGLVTAGAALCVSEVATVPLGYVLACALVGFVALGFQPQARWAVFACLALLTAGSALLPPAGEAAFKSLGWTPPPHFTRTRAANYSRVMTAARFVDEVARTQRTEAGRPKIWFWYDSTEPLATQHMSLSSLWLWGYSLINDQFPTWKQNGPTLAPGDLVVVTSQRPDAVARALESSGRDQAFVLRLLNARTVGKGDNLSVVAVFVLETRR